MTDWDGKSTLRQLQTRVADLERSLAEARAGVQLWKEQCQMVNARREEAAAETERVRLHWMGCCNESDHQANLATERAEAAETRLAAVAGALNPGTPKFAFQVVADARAALTAPTKPKED